VVVQQRHPVPGVVVPEPGDDQTPHRPLPLPPARPGVHHDRFVLQPRQYVRDRDIVTGVDHSDGRVVPCARSSDIVAGDDPRLVE
jgi:hypothetical protein